MADLPRVAATVRELDGVVVGQCAGQVKVLGKGGGQDYEWGGGQDYVVWGQSRLWGHLL